MLEVYEVYEICLDSRYPWYRYLCFSDFTFALSDLEGARGGGGRGGGVKGYG